MIGNNANQAKDEGGGDGDDFEDDAVTIQTAEAAATATATPASYNSHSQGQNYARPVNPTSNTQHLPHDKSNVTSNANQFTFNPNQTTMNYSYGASDAAGVGGAAGATTAFPQYPGYNNNYYGAGAPNVSATNDDFNQSKEQAKYLGNKAQTFINSHGGNHLLLVIASFLLLVKASSDEAEKSRPGYGFAIFVAILSLIMTSSHFYLSRKQGSGNVSMPDQFSLVILLALFLLWTLAVAVLTFGTTYSTTGNGYFSTWLGFFLAFTLFTTEATQAKSGSSVVFQRLRTLGWQLGTLLIASVVLFFASLSPCRYDCKGSTGYGLTIGILTTVFSFVVANFVDKFSHKVRLVLFGLVMGLWIGVVFVCTFVGPFVNTGNGYFACWAGAIASILLFHKVAQANSAEVATQGQQGKNVDMV